MIALKVYINTDDAFLVWKAPHIPGCLGFAIERQWVKRAGGKATPGGSEFLLNRVGFKGGQATPNQRQPSNVWPFQRFNWTDHEVSEDDHVKYRIVPMIGQVGSLVPDESKASAWVDARAVQPGKGAIRFLFNRPMASSQWMARIASKDKLKTSAQLVEAISHVDSDELRDFCGGTLIKGYRALFDEADGNKKLHLYAALFELKDEEIINRFCKLGRRAHIVLSNGSASEKEPDVNETGREAVHAAGCVVIDRMTSTPKGVGDLGHNKFIVVVEDGKPTKVLTGSTNLTPTGLFTQINNSVLIDSPELAQQYLDQWHRLANAQSDAPSTLKKSNPAPGKTIAKPAHMAAWFTPTVAHADLDMLKELIRGASQGILFLTFMPGPTGPLMDILEQRADGLFVRGVVNQFVGGAKGKLVAALTGANQLDPMDLDVSTPTGIKQQFSFWADEFMKGGKISVLVHSKVLCIDPFGDSPTIVTGSHNFSSLASESNDENFLVIKGDKSLAEAYAAHIISVYNHYRWRQYVGSALAAGKQPWQKLDDKDTWQSSRLHDPKQASEWAFWGL